MSTLLFLLLASCGSGPDKSADSSAPSTTPTGTASGTTGSGGGGTTAPTSGKLIQFDGEVPKNILWISIDTLRRDVWSRYGGDGTLPFLDSLMAEGFVLDDVRQCSNWTGAGTSCTMSGRHGIDAGFEPVLGAREGVDFIPDDSVFFAEVMRDQGYRTELITTNGWLAGTWGNTQGFDVERNRGGARAEAVLDEALADILTDPSDRPWFFHLHLIDPHAPYDPPESYLDALDGRAELPWDLSNRDEHYSVNAGAGYDDLSPDLKAELEAQLRIRYQAEIRMMDDAIADMWPVFDASRLLDDTLVVVWADHGEAFWEHGHQTHAWDLYDEENKVILFLWAKNLRSGSFDGPVSTIDLVPTLYDLYGIEAPPEVTGEVIDDIEAGRVRYSMANARAGVVQSITRDTQRILFYWRTGEVVVTDAATDPGETENLYDPADPMTLELWELLRPRVEQAVEAVDQGRWPVIWPAELPR